MLQFKSSRMIILGLVLIVAGWLLVFAMVINLIKETFFLSFIGYALGLSGFFIGFMAISYHWNLIKDRQDKKELRDYEDKDE